MPQIALITVQMQMNLGLTIATFKYKIIRKKVTIPRSVTITDWGLVHLRTIEKKRIYLLH